MKDIRRNWGLIRRRGEMLLKLGALLVSQEKPYMSTIDEVPERFPVKIAFTKKLNEQELTKLAVYALMVENGIDSKGG